MLGELITLPVRLGVRATQLWLRAAEEAARVATSTAGRLVDSVTSRDSRVEPTAPARSAQAVDSPTAEDVPAPTAEDVDVPVPTAEDAAFPAEQTPTATAPRQVELEPEEPTSQTAEEASEPIHVSEEPVLVEEFAEPGAEEGAGPEIHIEEPWDGYERMNARDIIERLPQSDSAELAAVALYERGHRGRHTILAAVERELRADGTRSRTE